MTAGLLKLPMQVKHGGWQRSTEAHSATWLTCMRQKLEVQAISRLSGCLLSSLEVTHQDSTPVPRHRPYS